MNHKERNVIYIMQVTSVSLIWVFVIGVAIWIFNLIRVAHDLNDALNASLGISLVAVPVFFTLASILTYVFVGLQKGRNSEDT